MGNLTQRAQEQFPTGEYEYRSYPGANGSQDSDGDGVNEIDCSNLVHEVLTDANYKIPYLPTRDILTSDGKLRARADKYFDLVDPADVKSGDMVFFRNPGGGGHIGFVDEWDPQTRTGTFYGSQTSTGPASASFGPEAGYWGKKAPVVAFIRPGIEPGQVVPDDPKPDKKKKPSADITPLDAGHPEPANPGGGSGTGGFWHKILAPIKRLWDGAVRSPARRVDPLAVDLDGDGIATRSLTDGAYFDVNADGFAEATGWVSPHDALLAIDLDQNGRIDDGRELFGDRSILSDGSTAGSGFDALRDWDTAARGGNQDGLIDERDAVWMQLQLWRDLDADGLTESGELSNAMDAGMAGISVADRATMIADQDGNIQRSVADVYWTSGSATIVAEYAFSSDPTFTQPRNDLPVPDEIDELPDLRGFGRVLDLHQAIVRDSSGVLLGLLSQFTEEPGAERRTALLEEILFRWTGCQDLAPNARGGLIDAKRLVVLERFLGHDFNGALGANPIPAAAIQLEAAYHDLFEWLYADLMYQSHLADLYDLVSYEWDGDAQAVKGSLAAVVPELDRRIGEDPSQGLLLLSEFARTLRGFAAQNGFDYVELKAHYALKGEEYELAFESGGRNVVSALAGEARLDGTSADDLLLGSALGDSITAYEGNDVVFGGEGDDVLSGCEDDDQLYGGVGRDNLFGAVGNDLLDGGSGNDRLNGGTGNDIYFLAPGSGQDEIVDYDTIAGNVDAIQVAASGAALAVSIWRRGNDLYVGLEGTDDAVHVREWFLGAANRVEEVILADGLRITAAALAAAPFTGSPQADVISGMNSDDTLEGLAGDDHLTGGYGNDVLDGGAGNDNLWGGFTGYLDWSGAGNDTYLFGRGYGQDNINDRDTSAGNLDTIRLVDLNASEVTVSRDNSNLYVAVNGSSERLTVRGWNDSASRVERIEFADGSVLDGAALASTPFVGTEGADTLTGTPGADAIDGLAGHDTLAGMAGDDRLQGGAGDDRLFGGTVGVSTSGGYIHGNGAGNDTFVVRRGDGRDTVYDYDPTPGNLDTLDLVDLNRDEVTVRRDADTLYVEVNGSGERISVPFWNLGAAYRIERIRFADGSVLEGAELDDIAILGTAGDDSLVGGDGPDRLLGLDGNDVLYGAGGNDILDGGAGNDTLYGGSSGYYSWAGAGSDVYVFGRGYGSDVVYDYDSTPGSIDTVRLKDLNAADVTIKRVSSSFVLSINGSGDQLRVADWSAGKDSRIERIEFADGSVLEGADLVAPFLGTAGDDTLTGTTEDDALVGLDGNDVLLGASGNDVLDGGTGNDTLYGGISGYTTGAGAGSDTYIFARGYGSDIIYDHDGTPGSIDTVRLKDLNAADVTIKRESSSFVLSVNGSGDQLRVADWSLGAVARIERIEFADGSVLEGADLVAPFLGTAGNDTLTGTTEDDVLLGLEGSDTLLGGLGNDVLDGGAGNDTLYGGTSGYTTGAGAGNDTYLFGRGYGQDVIYDFNNAPGNLDTVRLKDLNAADVTIKRVGSSFVLAVNGSSDELRVADWGGGKDYRIERIEFADGSVLEGAGLVAPFLGTAGNDTLTGTADDDALLGLDGTDTLFGAGGNDLLDGGSGNDSLYGGTSGYTSTAGAGNDTYRFGRGYGSDVIFDHDTTAGNLDTIELADLNAADVTIYRDSSSFYIAVNDSSDRIRVADWGLGAVARIERVKFADGSMLEGTALAATPFVGTEGVDNLIGTTEADVLKGLGGSDTLTGAGGDDTLDGGAGNDTLRGGIGGYTSKSGAGNDTYLFGRGYGVDNVYDFDDTPGNLDTIRLLDLNAADVTIRRNATTFFIDVNGAGDQIRVNDWGSGAAYRVERVELADGSALSAADLARVPYLGTSGVDSFTGTAENELMYGLGGNDTLNGMAGDDLIDGGDGNDVANGGDGNDVVLGGAGNDTLNGGTGGDLLDGGTGADRMSGNAGDDVFRVDDLGDQALESSNEGNDTVVATLTYTLADKPNLENVTLEGSADLNATGNAAANVLIGNDGANVLAGGAGNDTLRGAAGNDRLDGGTGNDVLEGGTGDDTFVFARGYGQDRASESGAGAGYDTVQFLAGVLPADVTVSTSGGSLILAINGTADTLTLEHWYEEAARIERVAFDNGTQWTWEALRAQLNRGPQLAATPDDVLVDEDSALSVVPGAGVFTDADPDDRLALSLTLTNGSALPEWLSFDATTGALTGAPGNADVATLALRLTGTDVYGASASTQFGLTVRNINDAPELVGSIADQVAFEGSELILGAGTGLFVDVDAGDVLTYAAALADGSELPAWLTFDAHAARFSGTPGNEDAGSWRVALTATDAAGAFAASEFLLTVARSAGVQLVGSPEPEVLSGTTGDDVIAGAEGADTLYGGGGADTLDGGPGADRLEGGSGDDSLHFAPDDLWIAPWTPPNRSDQDAYARWERLFQAFFRNRSLDLYSGGSGIDTLLGTDSGDGMVLDASFYDISAPAAASFVQIEAFVAGDGDDVIDLRSPTLVYGPATLDGGAGADFLWGNAGDDLLIGGDGYDVLDGGAGADRMTGGAGGDSYFVDDAQDLIIELAGEGSDKVTSSVTYALADNVEQLVLAGAGAIDGTGNALSNTLTGNAAANTLWGDAGDDLLRGGGGADLLIGGDGGDAYYLTSGEEQIEEAAGAGHDQVFAWFDQVLGANLEDLYLVSTLSALVGVGNDLDNRLFGNSANNLLGGGDGTDRLDAGTGNDLLVGGRADDNLAPGAGANVVLHNAGDGADRMTLGGTRMTVSLGGGTGYDGLALRRVGNDLVLETGAAEGVTLADWYGAQAARPQYLSLQTITEAMAQFDAGSADELLNKKVQQFDLKRLAQEYDQARAGDPTLDRWALMNRLLDARLAASDTEAIGGDLAYQYGTAGSLAGIGLTAAHEVVSAPQFGTQAQALRPLSELQTGSIKLT